MEPSDFSPHDGKFSFPLWEGKQWNSDYDYVGAHVGSVKTSTKVVSWERVTVPAGTFHTLKVVKTGQWRSVTTAGGIREVYWYSPDAKRIVKYELEDYATMSYELM